MASIAATSSRRLISKSTLRGIALGGWLYSTWFVFYNYQHLMTVDNLNHARELSEHYALEKVEDYKRFDIRYQNWKTEQKSSMREWRDKQIKKIMGKS